MAANRELRKVVMHNAQKLTWVLGSHSRGVEHSRATCCFVLKNQRRRDFLRERFPSDKHVVFPNLHTQSVRRSRNTMIRYFASLASKEKTNHISIAITIVAIIFITIITPSSQHHHNIISIIIINNQSFWLKRICAYTSRNLQQWNHGHRLEIQEMYHNRLLGDVGFASLTRTKKRKHSEPNQSKA